MATSDEVELYLGSHGRYQWLVSADLYLDEFLTLCPQAILGKYVAITSRDSGPYRVGEVDTAEGWHSHDNIAYSPPIKQIESIETAGFDEWFVNSEPFDLGKPATATMLDVTPLGEVRVFVNLYFTPHLERAEGLRHLFWTQLERIAPLTYLSDSHDFLTIITADSDLFAAARAALSDPANFPTQKTNPD